MPPFLKAPSPQLKAKLSSRLSRSSLKPEQIQGTQA
jgi:hypothetical protein